MFSKVPKMSLVFAEDLQDRKNNDPKICLPVPAQSNYVKQLLQFCLSIE